MNDKLKKQIPNILTSLRIVLTIVSFILFLCNFYYLSISIMCIAALTDFFDGKLARKYNAVSKTGVFLDVIADKIFELALIGLLLTIGNNKIIIVLSVEIVYIMFHFLYRLINKEWKKVFMAGKVKTWILFMTIILGFLSLKIDFVNSIYNIFIYISLLAEIIAIITIVFYLIKKKKGD